MKTTPLGTLVLGAVLVLFLHTGAGTASAQTRRLDEDLGRLLPAESHVIVVVPSIEEIDRRWDELVRTFAPDRQRAPGLLDWLADEGLADVLEVAALDRPWVLALQPPTQEGEEPDFTLVLPLRDPSIADEAIPRLAGDAEPHRRAGYVAYSTRSDYVAADAVPRLLNDVPDGDLVLRADAQRLVERYRPMLETWMSEAFDQDDGSAAVGEALLRVLAPLLDSARTLDIVVDAQADGIVLGGTLEVLPGSPLEPPTPQPSGQAALELARALPQDGGFLTVSALDLRPLADTYVGILNEMVDLSARLGGAGRDPDDLRRFTQRALEFYELSRHPWAGCSHVDLTGVHGIAAVRIDDAPAWLDRLAAFALELDGYGLGYRVIEIDPPATSLAGVRSFRIEMDLDALTEGMTEEEKASLAPMMGMVGAFLPPVHLVAEDDLLVAAFDATGGTALEQFLERLHAGDGHLSPPLRAALDWSGDAEATTVWDLSGLLALASMFTGGQPPDAATTARLQQAVFGSFHLDRGRYELRIRLDVPAFAAIVATFRAAQDRAKAGAGGKSNDTGEAGETGTTGDTGKTGGVHGGGAASISTMTLEEAQALADEVSERVEAIRGLEFKAPVPVQIVDDETARDHFVARLRKFLPEDRLADQQAVYEDLGLLGADVDLEQEVLDLLREQAGGYYDPGRGTMFLLDDMPRDTAAILLAHELTHALDDQHFAIDAAMEKSGDDDDRQMAYTAVVEGSGTLVMTSYLMQELMSGGITQDALDEFQQTEAGKATAFRSAPTVLQRSLLAPYILGQRFLLRGDMSGLVGGVQSEDLDHAFRWPPVSTEQILHPDKYWDEAAVDLPREIDLGDVASVLGAGWTSTAHGVFGELELAGMTGASVPSLSDPMAMTETTGWTTDAATGWDGDQWVLLRKGPDTVTLLATVWSSVSDAAEFETALALPASAVVRRSHDAVVVVAGEASRDEAGRLADAALDRVLAGE